MEDIGEERAGRMATLDRWREEAAEMVRALGRLAPRVSVAMQTVPRHRFVSPTLRSEAYLDMPLPLGNEASTISAPHMVAIQLEWAELDPGLRVLEIGSGSGYLLALAALLVAPAGRVTGVEIDPVLVQHSRAILGEMGLGHCVEVVEADGRDGLPASAPYDRILVSCASPMVPSAWTDQLAAPGILEAPFGPRAHQILRRLRRTRGADHWEDGVECRFVALESPAQTTSRPDRI